MPKIMKRSVSLAEWNTLESVIDHLTRKITDYGNNGYSVEQKKVVGELRENILEAMHDLRVLGETNHAPYLYYTSKEYNER